MEVNQILELYKLHVEMTDRVSQRRGSLSQFYITVLTGIIGGLAFIIEKK